MKILYKKILDLEFWHDYYLSQLDLTQSQPSSILLADYDILDTLLLVPTLECTKLLKNLHWVFRPQPRGASLFAAVDEVAADNSEINFQTVISIDRPYRFTFWLMVRDQNFANFTNLPFNPNRNQIYYFSNLSKNSNNPGNILFLTEPLPKYEANHEYQLGQLVVTDDGKTLEAIRYQGSAAATPQDDEWDEILSASQYVSGKDQAERQGLFRTDTMTSVELGDKLFSTLTDVNDRVTFASETTVPETHSSGSSFVIGLNFTGQAPGYYSYRLLKNGSQEGETKEFVLVDPISDRDAFALVEIVLNENKVSPAFSLLQSSDEQSIIQPRTYVVRFKNRSTYWRYRYEKAPTVGLSNDFDQIDPKTFVTKRPKGLQFKPASFLTDINTRRLPAPSATRIKPEIDDQQHVTKILSDIHL